MLHDRDPGRFREAVGLGEPAYTLIKGEVRLEAARALRKLADPRSLKPLCRALEDDDWWVRREVVVALAELKDARAIRSLGRALADPMAPVRSASAAALAESHGVKKAQVNTMLMDMVGAIAKHLKKGKRIRLNGLGILQVRKRPARMGRNPATGEAIKIKASKKIAFRASKELKAAV